MKRISRREKLEAFIDRVEFAFTTLQGQVKHTCIADPCGLCYSMEQSSIRILKDGRELLKGMRKS